MFGSDLRICETTHRFKPQSLRTCHVARAVLFLDEGGQTMVELQESHWKVFNRSDFIGFARSPLGLGLYFAGIVVFFVGALFDDDRIMD